MRVYLKNGKNFRISQTLAEKLIDHLEETQETGRKGDLVYVKETNTGSGKSKLVLAIDVSEIVAIK